MSEASRIILRGAFDFPG